MKAKCPHCGKQIDLMTAGDLADQFDINSNKLQHAKEVGRFPRAWLSFPNRDVWLARDIRTYIESRELDGASKALAQLKEATRHLEPSVAKKMLRELQAEIDKPSK